MINELRLRLPFSERDVVYEKALNTSLATKEESPEAAQAVRVAQATIESMKLMLEKKDENITKYQGIISGIMLVFDSCNYNTVSLHCYML